VESPR